MEVANASLYDGASALAEAVLMAGEAQKRKEILISTTVHPEYREVVKTYARGQGLCIVEVPFSGGVTDMEVLKASLSVNTAAVVVQNPNFFGCIEPMLEIGELAHGQGALYITAVDPISLGILKAPGEYGADIVVGDGQALGNATSFGGPHLGFMATSNKLVRRMPGRIVGQTVDNKGRRAFVLTLQAREQHIRREKATSNICSNQALNALAATIYLCLLGKKGLRELAELCLQKAHYLAGKLAELPGYQLAFPAPFFKEFVVITPIDPGVINQHLLKEKILGGLNLGEINLGEINLGELNLGGQDLGSSYPQLAGQQMFAVTERRTKGEMDNLVAILSRLNGHQVKLGGGLA
jgi:glycine dehydrogenase subunit 1